MPNATVRANAQALPKTAPQPGAPSALAQATVELETLVAEIKDRPGAENLAKRIAFDRAYSRWLAARAARDNPDAAEDFESANRRDEECARAERELILMPAVLGWMVWHKFEVFTLCLEEDLRTGERTDHFSLLALAAIKADLIRLGICELGLDQKGAVQ